MSTIYNSNNLVLYICLQSSSMSLCRWHKLGISVKGNSATAILDCSQQDTKEVSRDKEDLKTDGIILYGQEIDDSEFFDVRMF